MALLLWWDFVPVHERKVIRKRKRIYRTTICDPGSFKLCVFRKLSKNVVDCPINNPQL